MPVTVLRSKLFDMGNNVKHIKKGLAMLVLLGLVVGCIYLITTRGKETEYMKVPEVDPDRIEDGIHVRTGLIEADGLAEVVTHCTSCHSAQLVTQNRMDKEGWIATIRWMQETQNLWDLGANEAIIVDYLVTNYPPVKKGRRQALQDVEWYVLEE